VRVCFSFPRKGELGSGSTRFCFGRFLRRRLSPRETVWNVSWALKGGGREKRGVSWLSDAWGSRPNRARTGILPAISVARVFVSLPFVGRLSL
jgi:hypothetical protein